MRGEAAQLFGAAMDDDEEEKEEDRLEGSQAQPPGARRISYIPNERVD